MLEVSHDAVAVEEEQLVSCAAGQSKYCSICTVTLTLAASRVGFVGCAVAAALTVCTVVMPSAVAARNIGMGPFWGGACGDML